MNIFKTCIIAAIICVLYVACTNQGHNYGTGSSMWKRRVSRIISFPREEDSANKGNAPDETLAAMLINAVASGKIKAYSDFYVTKLSAANLEEILHGNDTMYIKDSPTAILRKKITKHELSTINSCRLVEDWAFDPGTGKTTIQIKGFELLRDTKNEDGSPYGVTELFWLNFEDAISIAMQYDKANPNATFTNCIWGDNFSNSVITQSVTKGNAIRPIYLYEQEDTVQHHLENAVREESLYTLLTDAITSGEVAVYQLGDSNFINKVSITKIYSTWGETDTIAAIDSVTGKETKKLISSRPFESYKNNFYNLLEKWDFDPKSGKTNIQIDGIALTNPMYDSMSGEKTGGFTICWMRYSDAQPIISGYEQHHPGNTIALAIWKSYFEDDVKSKIQY